MWISFPITRGIRVIMPWFLVPFILPLALAGWVLSLTFWLIVAVWTHPKKRRRSDDATAEVRIRIRG